MNSTFRPSNARRGFLRCIILACAASLYASADPAPIPFAEIGAKATAEYRGEAIGITTTADGVRLHTGFQKLAGTVTREGLSLASTEAGGGTLKLTATAIGRGATKLVSLPAMGRVAVAGQSVTFTRPGLVEEYSVSVDGVRQDFIVEDRLAGVEDLSVDLALSGATAEAAADGAKLVLTGSGRELVYNRLRVTDAQGRELPARMEVLSASRIAVRVADERAAYPIRIDPTFSDADWTSLNPGIPGANNLVRSAVVDGAGNLYIGGDFTFVGTVAASRIAKWNGSTWSALGTGVNNSVNALAVSGTDLFVGGIFVIAGGNSANRIAKWNGTTWSALGTGANSTVNALAVSGADLFVGGAFTSVDGGSASRIAKWNGSAWSALGVGIGGTVNALAVNGADLFAGGTFATAGGGSAVNVAKWNGSAWSALGAGTSGAVSALAVNGADLFVGGNFVTAGVATVNSIAKWNGTVWSALGTGMNGTVSALAVSGSNLFVGGSFTTAGGSSANRVAKWDGSAWSALSAGMDNSVSALAVSGTNLFAGGQFGTAGVVAANRVAKFDGSAWSALGTGMNGAISALAVSGTDIIAGGSFTTAGGVPAGNIAKWNGSVWSAFGAGMNGSVSALVLSGTDIIAGGTFTTAGGVAASNIAKWNGSAWSAFGAGTNGTVSALAVSGTDVFVGGTFTTAGGVAASNIAKWNGTIWSSLGLGTDNTVSSLALNGPDLVAGGNFSLAGGVMVANIAKWNGSVWSVLGTGTSGTVSALAVSGADLVAGGTFTTAGGVTVNNIAKWNGSAWSALGTGTNGGVSALAVSGSNLFVGGSFTTAGGSSANRIAKWSGGAWSPFGTGADSTVRALAADASNHLFVGGLFTLVGTTTVSPFIAQANLAVPHIVVNQVGALIDGVSSVNFGTVPEGSSVPLTFTVTNPGTADLTGLAITGATSEFVVSGLSGTSVPIGAGSVTFTVTFSPAAIGIRNAAIQIASNAPGAENPFDIALTGVGANAAPTDITLSASSIAENNAANASIGTLSAADPNVVDTHVFTFAAGGADNGSFTITGNVLTINDSADFETKSSYAVRIRATDSGTGNLTFEKNFTINITDVTIPQTITFGPLGNKIFGDSAFAVSATGGASGQPVTFSVASGPASVAGNVVTISGAGSVTVRASQAGVGDYSAAADVDQTFSVAKAAQAITFTNPGPKTFGDAAFPLAATGGDSGNMVTFSIVGGPATVAGNTLTITGAGSVTVRASQAGNANYFAAADVDQTFTVAKAAQATTFTNPGAKTFGDAAFPLVATGGDSGNAVTFSIVSGPATVAGNTLTITGAGSVTVRASQAGNANYFAAADVDETFTVAKAAQAITFTNPGPKTFGDAAFPLVATGGGSGNAVTFSIVSGPATVAGNTLTITGAGGVTVRASQAGNANYFAAADVDETFTVAKATQAITFTNPGAHSFGDAAFALAATGGGSGEGVLFSIVSGPATVAGNMLTITGAGSITVRASQAGNADYFAAADVDETFAAAEAGQTITFTNPGPKTFGDAPFALVATGGGSGNAVTFAIVSGPATVLGNTLTITGAGSVTVRASQSGNMDYAAAADVDRTFNVDPASQVITFAALAGKTFGDAPFTVSATGGASGEPVIFSILSGPATIAGNLVTITGAGSVTVRASQAGTANYAAATPVDQSFAVAKIVQVITFTAPAAVGSSDTVLLSATGGASGNAVVFSVFSGPGILAGNSLTFSGAGTVVVRASQAGNANYEAATPVDASISAQLNTVPVAVDDAVTITTGDATVYPLANDIDEDGGTLSITSVSEPSVTIDGRALVVPAGYTGTFHYTITDGLSSDSADVVVTPGSAVVGAVRYSGLLYNNAGKIAGRASMSRTASGRNVLNIRIGSGTGVAVFNGLSGPGMTTAVGTVDAALEPTNRVSVAISGGIAGSLRPAVNSETVATQNVGLLSVDAAIPGAGFGRVTVTAIGLARFSLKMPDGKTFLTSAEVSDNGSINFYGRQSGTSPAGFIGGELILADLAKTDFTGEIEWNKPAQASGLHRGGVNTVLVANGCEATGGLGIPDGAAVLKVSGGNLPSLVVRNTTVLNGIVAPDYFTLTGWTPQQSGLTFRATLKQPDAARFTLGTGLYFPKSQTALGFFPGTTLGGKIELRVP